MTIESWPLERIIPYGNNARKIPKSAVDAVAVSLREFGWQQPIVVDVAGVIIVGHTRLLAALQLGLREAPVHVADKLTPAQIKAYRLMDNRSHDNTSWNMQLIGPELLELKAMNFDLAMTGFTLQEIGKLAPETHVDAPAQIERADELQAKWQVARGDVWEIGRHRLMCGDCTSNDVAILMAGELADMVFTDPPYGVKFGEDNHNPRAKEWEAIQNDEKQGADLRLFLRECFSRMVAASTAAAPVYCWSPKLLSAYEMLLALGDVGVHIQSQLVWVKNVLVLGQADYQWRHEFCWYGWTKGQKHYWCGSRKLTTVWDHSKDANSAYLHPMQKPASLAREALANSCKPDGSVLDLFSGSGSTMVAAQQANRRCYGMEIEPKYCAVILERMKEMGVSGVRLQPIKEPYAAGRPEQVPAI